MINLSVDTTLGNQEVTMSSTNVINFPGSTREKKDHLLTPEQVQESSAGDLVMLPIQMLAMMLDREASYRTKRMIRESLCHYDFSPLDYPTTTTQALFTHMEALRLSFVTAEHEGKIEHLLEAARIATFLATLETSRPRDVYPLSFGDSKRSALYYLVNFYRIAFYHKVTNHFGKEVQQGKIINIRQVISLVTDHTECDWQEDNVTVSKVAMIRALASLKKLAGIS